MQNPIRHLVNSYRAVFKKTHIGYLVLIAVLATSGVLGACPLIIGGIQQDGSMDFEATVYPNSSLAEGTRTKGASDGWFHPTIKDGPNTVIAIGRASSGMAGYFTSKGILLETSQAGLEINENEITITEWTRACIQIIGQRDTYASSNGSGVLKIRKEGASFHGTASFTFTDPSVERVKTNSKEHIDWTF